MGRVALGPRLRRLGATAANEATVRTGTGAVSPSGGPGPGLRATELRLHGHRVTYRTGGSGPPLVLLHGIANSSATWEAVAPWLTQHFTLIAPDLMGHGDSAKPRGDYSLGAHASGVRDLMVALGHRHATVVGHSLGGGVALQFAYQFPEVCERLVLVASGGLGREVHALLRAAALPGAEYVLPLLTGPRLLSVGRGVGRGLGGLLGRLRLQMDSDLQEISRAFVSLGDPDARQAFLHTLRSVIEPGGQRIDAHDRLYLAAAVPTLIVWGERDPIIPVAHGEAAHAAMPGSRFERFERAGHMPHVDDPRRFAELLADFVTQTEPARLGSSQWQALLRAEPAA